MGKIHVNTYSLKQHRAEIEELRRALLNVIPGMGEQERDGKGKAPEQIMAAGGKLDKTAYSLNSLMYETTQALKKIEEGMTNSDESVARAFEWTK